MKHFRLRFGMIACVSLFSYANTFAEGVEDDFADFDDTPMVSEKAEKTEKVKKAKSEPIPIGDENDDMDGFDDEGESTDTVVIENNVSEENELDEVPVEDTSSEEEKSSWIPGLTGKITEQVAYSLYSSAPHNDISSVKSTLFLDYEHKFENGWKLKANARAYYDAIYSLRGTSKFSAQELKELRSEIELFDAYLEGSLTDNFDVKVGRQVVVWGRSDTLRVTDVLNPLDNRRPAMVDIEDLRLPVTMAKFDYFIGDWRITPIAILEQRFSKNPPFGSVFNPSPLVAPSTEKYDDVTYALSVGAEFSAWDVNFYAARLRNDEGQLVLPSPTQNTALIKHDKINMFGTAVNVLSGSWLFKTELAYFDGLKYFSTGDEEFSRTDLLLGVEYNGIADTLISYDIVSRNFSSFNPRLNLEAIPLRKNDYQHAFRVSSDFINATVTVNYLLSLYGEKLDEGGFQRAWVKYDLLDGVNVNVGVVDYIGGSALFDVIKDNDMIFADIAYSF
ncbi:MAG: DUF1302 family protein [Sulfurovum sp.]|nr:DUF1302 family protein [Sulfurovum sp.]